MLEPRRQSTPVNLTEPSQGLHEREDRTSYDAVNWRPPCVGTIRVVRTDAVKARFRNHPHVVI